MSPEQASSSGTSVDTRYDVYSLGVMLYELLSGLLPYNLHGLPLTEVLRKIGEDSTPRPSTRFRARGMDAAAAHNRHVLPEALHQELQGDLDAIVIKALEKNPANRYGSPAELAADIARYLHNEPVDARPASTLYFARKYVRRHRAAVAAVLAAALLLLSFGVWQSVYNFTASAGRKNVPIALLSSLSTCFESLSPARAAGTRSLHEKFWIGHQPI